MKLQRFMGFFGIAEGRPSTVTDLRDPVSSRRGSRTTSTSSNQSIVRTSSKASAGSVGDRLPSKGGTASRLVDGTPSKTRASDKMRSSSNERPRSKEPYNVVDKLSAETLEETMERIAHNVKAWESHSFELVKNLQVAMRNQGRVDLVRLREGDRRMEVAVKRMPNKWVCASSRDFNSQHPTSTERPWIDFGILKHLNDINFPYACELIDVFRDKDNTYVATSLAKEGDLFSWCDGEPFPGKAREETMPAIACQIFSALRCLHELGIAHRDVSLENILLAEQGPGDLRVKIIDFGMSTLSRMCRREVRGKQSYQAPEMHLEPEYDAFIADSFAVGVVLFAMAASDYPWTSTKRNQCQLFEYVSMFGFRKFLMRRKLRKGNGEHLIAVFSPSFSDLLEGLLQTCPKERLTLGESCFASSHFFNQHSVWQSEWVNNAARAGLLSHSHFLSDQLFHS